MLRRWLQARRQRRAERQRTIFSYWDGQQERRIDPLVAWERMWADAECKIDEDLKGWQRNELEAIQRIYGCVCRMFGLQPYEQGGLTIQEALELFNRFLAYVDDIKKKQGGLPIPFRLWAAGFSRSRSEQTTPSAAGSSGTPSVSRPAGDTGSTEPSSQPSVAPSIASG